MALDHPTGRIVDQGTPLVDFYKIATAANCYPGRLVIKDTTDNQVQVCGAGGAALGWLGYEDANENFRPDTVDTIYEDDDFVPVLFGGHFTIVGRLAYGESVAAGAKLKAAADGELAEAIVGTDYVVAIARETVDATSAAADIRVSSLI